MRIAITGGTGFVGRHLAARLTSDGHDVVLAARGRRELAELPAHTCFHRCGLDDVEALRDAFDGCDAIAHCAGINREIGSQTYRSVHVDGTRNVITAARGAGVERILMLSFLRARPACGSAYHESKHEAEQLLRSSGLEFTILKPGVIYGSGDHMLDHLGKAVETFPAFATVGLTDPSLRPVAVEDVAAICAAALVEGRLPNQTVAVLGPEPMSLREAVLRVAAERGRKPFIFRAPVWVHRLLARAFERLMVVPLIASAQVRILAEGVTEPLGVDAELPDDMRPVTRLGSATIRAGLPAGGGFARSDLRICTGR